MALPYVHRVTSALVMAEVFIGVEGGFMHGPLDDDIILITDSYGRARLMYAAAFVLEYEEASEVPEPTTIDLFRDVCQFHEKFGLGYAGDPRPLPDEVLELRLKLHNEECNEYVDASAALESIDHYANPKEAYVEYMAEALDAMVDLVYVALGTAALHGFDFNTAWRRVHSANMRKVRAERAEQSKRGSSFDVVKPAGWVAPDHRDLVGSYRP